MATEHQLGAAAPAREGTRQHFDELLNQIRQELVTMGSLVLENVRRAGDAMVETDSISFRLFERLTIKWTGSISKRRN